MDKKLRFAFIGCGGFATSISKYLAELPKAEIVAACDVDRDRADTLAKKLAATPYYSTDELYKKADFDAVMVITPNDMHCLNSVEAARHGKHIFCEKPMARNIKECRDMVRAAQEGGVKIMVGHKRRLRPSHRYMTEIVKRGRLGAPVAINISCIFGKDSIPRWWAYNERSGGMLAWNGVHDLDFMRCICGDVKRVHAIQSKKSHMQHDYPDCVFVTLEFSSGAVGSFQGGFYFPLQAEFPSSRIAIICEQGGISYDGSTITVKHLAEGGDVIEKTYEEYGAPDAYRLELSSFIDWVLSDQPPVLSWEEGLKCVEIMDAAYLSIETAKSIELPLP